MMRMRVGYLGLALGPCWAAPAEAVQDPLDSAGVRIVENARPAWGAGQGWRLSEQPILTIGGPEGSTHHLGRIAGVTRLSDGTVVVADQGARLLKFFDASGRLLRSMSVQGQNAVTPDGFQIVDSGEFQGIDRLAGDSIAVEARDWVTVLAPTGTVARTLRYGPFERGALQTPFAFPLGRFANGTTVLADYPQGERGPAGAKQWVDSASLFLAGPTGAVIRPLAKAPMVVFAAAGSNRPSPMDFGPQASYASSGRAFYWGFPERYEVRAYDSDWKLQRIIRRAWTPRPFTVAERDAYVDGWMEMWSKKTGAEREAERTEMRQDVYPEFLPAYSDVLATPAGEILAREPDLTGAPACWCLNGLATVPSRWSVFDGGGRWLGEVAMPARFIPVEIGADYVLGRSRGEDNVTRAVMYRLDKQP